VAVMFTTTVEGTVDEFEGGDGQGAVDYTRSLAALAGVDASAIALSVTSASVRVDATITTGSEAEADLVLRTLTLWQTAGNDAVSTRLGVQLEGIEVPYVILRGPGGSVSPPPPSNDPSSVPGTTQGQATGDDDLSGGVIAIVIWICVFAILLVGLGVLWCVLKKKRDTKPSGVITAVSVHTSDATEVYDVEVMRVDEGGEGGESTTAAAMEPMPTQVKNVVIRPMETPTRGLLVGSTPDEDDETSPEPTAVQREWLAREALTPGLSSPPQLSTPGQ